MLNNAALQLNYLLMFLVIYIYKRIIKENISIFAHYININNVVYKILLHT